MFKKVLKLTTILLIFSAGEIQAAVTHSTWVGSEQGEWGRASNWDPARVPDNSSWQTFVVKIDSNSIGIDEIEVGLQQSHTIDQLDCYGNVGLGSLVGWVELILADASGLTNYGDLNIEEIDINGNVTNTTGAMLHLDTMEIEGNLYNQAGATVDIDYEIDVEEGDLENAGLIMIAPSGEIYVNQRFNNVGQILISGGECGADEEILDNNDTGVIQGFGFLYADQLLQNKGAIYASGGSLVILGGGSITNTGILANKAVSSLHIKLAKDVNNFGTIEVNAGGGVAVDCNIVNEPKAVIKLLGGTLAAKTITQSAGTIFEGFGGITGNVIIESNGLIKLTGPTNIVGDVTIEHNAILEISNGQTLIVGHTTNNGEIRVVNGDVVFQGGYSGKGIVKKE